MGLETSKQRLRRELAARRAGIDAACAARAAAAVAAHVEGLPEFRVARRVVLYAAFGGELPTAPLYRAARAAGKQLLWPRLRTRDALEFAACASLEALVRGPGGFQAPPPAAPVARPEAGDLVLLPCLAFDAAGFRLGRGGGHYDRAFPVGVSDAPCLVGVGFAFQRVAAVPVGAGDRRLDAIVTECGVLRSPPPPCREGAEPAAR